MVVMGSVKMTIFKHENISDTEKMRVLWYQCPKVYRKSRDRHPKHTNTDTRARVFLAIECRDKQPLLLLFSHSQRSHQIKTRNIKALPQQETHGSKIVTSHGLVGTDVLLP